MLKMRQRRQAVIGKRSPGVASRGADRSAVVGDRGLAGAGAAIRDEALVKAGRGDCDAASTRGRNGRRGGEGDRVAVSYCSRRLLGYPEEEARAHPCVGPRGARPGLPHRRAGERMRPAIRNASARQHSGGPSPVAGRGGSRNEHARKIDRHRSCGMPGVSFTALNVTNWPRPYSYPLTTSDFSISSPVLGSCGRSAIRVA